MVWPDGGKRKIRDMNCMDRRLGVSDQQGLEN